MSLLDLKTNLKSLKFGGDRFDGGSSNQPFIQTSIPDTNSDPSVNQPDFLLRQEAIKHSLVDVERLSKWFITPAGLQFVAKQELLSNLAVRTQASTGPFNDGIYNPINTLFEAGVVALGQHINKQGLLINSGPQYLASPIIRKVIGDNQLKSSTNRLIQIFDNTIQSINSNVISYPGGPGSVLGIGKTNIKLATDQNGAPLRVNDNNYNFWSIRQILFPSDTEDGLTPGNPASIINTNIIDFRTKLKRQTKSLPYNGPEAKNIESRINLGNPGEISRVGVSRRNYVGGIAENDTSSPEYGAAGSFTFDKINALPLYKAANVNGIQPSALTNDLVQFRLAAIDGDNPSQKIFMHFRAFLDSINDSYTGDWNATKYVGRGENFYTYQGFDRKVSFGFTVAAQSKVELMPMYRKLNFLASNLAPDYSPTRGYMRGPLMQLSIGGYFYEQPGFITSLTYEISQDSTWEVGIGTNPDTKTGQIIPWSDGSVKELPHMIKVNVQFTPIHEFRPQKLQLPVINQAPDILDAKLGNTVGISNSILRDSTIGNNYPSTRYIALANGHGTTKNNYDEFVNGAGTPSNNDAGPIGPSALPPDPLPPPPPQLILADPSTFADVADLVN